MALAGESRVARAPLSAIPTSLAITRGLCRLLRQTDRSIIITMGRRKVAIVDGRPQACTSALVRCVLGQHGEIRLTAAGYVFPRDDGTDMYVDAHPASSDRPYDVTRVRRVELIIPGGKGELLIRCELRECGRGTKDEAWHRSGSEVEERFIYCAIEASSAGRRVTRIAAGGAVRLGELPDLEVLAIASCIQACIPPSAAAVGCLLELAEEALARRSPRALAWREAYLCLLDRRKHDQRSCEASKAPYDTWDYSSRLMKVDRPTSSLRDVEADAESYLLVPPCADPLRCLLRKSLGVLTVDLVEERRYGSRSVHVTASGMTDDRLWEPLRASSLEVLLRSGAKARDDPRTIARVSRSLGGLPEVWTVPPPRGGDPTALRRLPCLWTLEAVTKLVSDIFLSHRIRRFAESSPEPRDGTP
jgi:hypothetical protein